MTRNVLMRNNFKKTEQKLKAKKKIIQCESDDKTKIRRKNRKKIYFNKINIIFLNWDLCFPLEFALWKLSDVMQIDGREKRDHGWRNFKVFRQFLFYGFYLLKYSPRATDELPNFPTEKTSNSDDRRQKRALKHVSKQVI